MATALLAALLGGCSFLSKEADATEVSSEAETESPSATQESETETTETEETQESHEAAEDEESGEEETEDHFVEKKIVVATDMHYFAEKLAGNRCDSFVGMARGGDGRVLEYGAPRTQLRAVLRYTGRGCGSQLRRTGLQVRQQLGISAGYQGKLQRI